MHLRHLAPHSFFYQRKDRNTPRRYNKIQESIPAVPLHSVQKANICIRGSKVHNRKANNKGGYVRVNGKQQLHRSERIHSFPIKLGWVFFYFSILIKSYDQKDGITRLLLVKEKDSGRNRKDTVQINIINIGR